MQKIQIRQINDMSGNNYKIYDHLVFDEKSYFWRSVTTYFSLEEATMFNSNIEIEDLTTYN